jgi:hypothetical protein
VLCGKLLESQLCGLCCPLLVMTYIHTISPRPAGEGWLFRSHWGDSLGCSKRGSHHYISETFFFFLRFIYFMYVSTLLLSSDTPEEGIRFHYEIVVNHHVVDGN